MKKINSASIDITYKCNYRCKHCYNSSGCHDNTLEMTDDKVIKVAEQIAEYKPNSICICGGEPLLRKELVYEFSKTLKKINPETIVSMVTNGYFMTKEIAENLKKAGIEHIQISLDGSEPSTHDWLRQEGAFDAAVNGLKILKEMEIDSAIAFAPSRRNIHQLGDTIDLAYSLGCTEMRMQPLMLIGRAVENKEDFSLNYRDYMLAKRVIDEKNKKYINEKFNCIWGDPISHLRAAKTHTFYHLIVSATGSLLASPYLPISFGNVDRANLDEYIDGGLFDVMHSNKLAKYLIEHIDSSEELNLTAFGFSGKNDGELIDLDILSSDYLEKTESCLQKILDYSV